MFEFYWIDKRGEIQKSTNHVEANNSAYWACAKLEVHGPDGLINRFIPKKLILNNLIDNGFHSHYINKNT